MGALLAKPSADSAGTNRLAVIARERYRWPNLKRDVHQATKK
jgi:hypothetical protein